VVPFVGRGAKIRLNNNGALDPCITTTETCTVNSLVIDHPATRGWTMAKTSICKI
jgi:hypothetical protein